MRTGFKKFSEHEDANQEMIFGIHPVTEAVKSGQSIDKVLIQQGLQHPQQHELRKMLQAEDIPMQIVPREKLDRLSRRNHQGLIALVSPVAFHPLEEILNRVYEAGRDPFILLLDRVTDVRNFGAICRTAYCAGVDAVVIPARGSARIGGDAVKTSAGALLHLPVCRSANLKETIEQLKSSGLQVVSITEKAKEDLFGATLSGPVCLILGSEEDGISGEYLRRSDRQLSIPMAGQTGSLNVSVAAALALYEVMRKRLK